MRTSRARYILRFDDLCPTMERSRWERLKALVVEYGLRPILAVVPDNRDSNLAWTPSDSAFWAEMRALQASGATIGLHGYRHLCASTGQALLALADKSEFAGVDEGRQLQWIRAGMKILRAHGLEAKIWVAPNHGFDRGTINALRGTGISMISDGLTRFPFTRYGVVWIPQQLWGAVEKMAGIWTICIHGNTIRLGEIEELALFVRGHTAQFTSVEDVVREYTPQELGWNDALYARYASWRIQLSRLHHRILSALSRDR